MGPVGSVNVRVRCGVDPEMAMNTTWTRVTFGSLVLFVCS